MKICVADDEQEVRRSIIAKLNGSGVKAEVFDVGFGSGALEGILAVRPELAILDIRMPEMDGLSLLKAVKRKEPGIQVAMLTGYSDFAYAKQAIHLGAMDYLLKPVDREELNGVVLRVAEGLAARLREELLWLYGCMEEGGRSGVQVDINPHMAGLWYDTRVAKRVRYAEAEAAATAAGQPAAAPDAEEQPQGRASEPPGMAVPGSDGLIASVRAGREIIRIEEAGRDALGAVFHEGRDAARVWAREQASWRRSRFFGGAASPSSGLIPGAAGKAAALRKRLAGAAGTDGRELAELFTAWSAQAELLSPEEARRECAELLALLEPSGLAEGLGKRTAAPAASGGWTGWVESVSTWDELRRQVRGLLEGCAARERDGGAEGGGSGDNGDRWFRQALSLMDSPANAGLTLESAAQAIGLHPVTLSRLFKRRTGVNFVRFLISRRLERAKTLLLETGEPVASVAAQAGYADLRHFNRLFKAEFGQTPGKFRKARRREG